MLIQDWEFYIPLLPLISVIIAIIIGYIIN